MSVNWTAQIAHHNLKGQLTACEKTSIEIHKDLCGKLTRKLRSPHPTPKLLLGNYCSIESDSLCRGTTKVHKTPKEFKNGGSTLKIHKMFSVHTTPEEFKNIITGQFGFVFEENLGEEITSSSLRFQNVFRPHENEKPAFSNSCGAKNVSWKLHFRDV